MRVARAPLLGELKADAGVIPVLGSETPRLGAP